MPPKKDPKVTIPAGGDAEAGGVLFAQQCSACHAPTRGGDKNAAAPGLGGIMGRSAADGEFPYSAAMKKSGIVWSDAHMFVYLKAPAKYVPGTRMSYAGVPKDKDRADLIAYLHSIN